MFFSLWFQQERKCGNYAKLVRQRASALTGLKVSIIHKLVQNFSDYSFSVCYISTDILLFSKLLFSYFYFPDDLSISLFAFN